MGEIIKAEFDICTSKNTRGQRVDYKGTTNANPVNDIHRLTERKTTSFLKTERRPNVWRAGG